ncbi:MAG: response regulator transcription factor [Ruminococcaceae bacterium]|nr:response regulator transcription factor [Oscillospiraceae bacterium]
MIYLLEDDAAIRKLIVYTLKSGGMEAEGFPAPSLFYEALEKETPELILLDIMLPEEDGLSVLARLRSTPATRNVPVLILTAKSSEFDKVIGLDSGADDYMTKPFGMMELLSRVRALLRRSKAHTPDGDLLRVGALTVSPSHHTAEVDGVPVTLSLKEFKLLCLLLEKNGAVATRDEILTTIWGYSFDGESRTVDVHIRNLRQKLGSAGECIETVKGMGYKIERK